MRCGKYSMFEADPRCNLRKNGGHARERARMPACPHARSEYGVREMPVHADPKPLDPGPRNAPPPTSFALSAFIDRCVCCRTLDKLRRKKEDAYRLITHLVLSALMIKQDPPSRPNVDATTWHVEDDNSREGEWARHG